MSSTTCYFLNDRMTFHIYLKREKKDCLISNANLLGQHGWLKQGVKYGIEPGYPANVFLP